MDADFCVMQRHALSDYGYSGVAKPANSNANIAMYAVGGAAAGAVAGAGAMYAYNNMILGCKMLQMTKQTTNGLSLLDIM